MSEAVSPQQLSLDSIPDEPEDWHAWIQWLADPVNNPQMRKAPDDESPGQDPTPPKSNRHRPTR